MAGYPGLAGAKLLGRPAEPLDRHSDLRRRRLFQIEIRTARERFVDESQPLVSVGRAHGYRGARPTVPAAILGLLESVRSLDQLALDVGGVSV